MLKKVYRYAGLGNTVKEIDVTNAKVFSKTVFSMVIPEVDELIKQDVNRKSVVLFGIEVCTLQQFEVLVIIVCITHSTDTGVCTADNPGLAQQRI